MVPDDAELASDALWQAGAVAIGEQAVGDRVRLIAGFEDADAAATGGRAVSVHSPVVVTAVEDDSYLDTWRDFARCSKVGRVVVRPAWVALEGAEPGDVVVELETGRAFGSGVHPTTQLALAALQAVGCEGRRVLDVGTGSGVLSVAAVLLGAREVVAVDHDPEAVEVAAGNVERNGVAGRVAVGGWTVDEVDGVFDVVVANLGGVGVLRSLSAGLVARLAPGARLVVGGMLDGTEDGAVEAFPSLAVERRDQSGDWVELTLTAVD